MPQRVSMRIWAHEHFKGRHWFVRKQNLFYFLFTGNIHNKPSHPHFSITYFPNDLKNKWPALYNPTDFSAGNKKRQCKKQHPSKHSHLWTSQPESSSKFRVPWSCPPLSAWSWHSQGTRRFFCQWSTCNPHQGSRAASTAAELLCWLSPNPVVFTAFKPGKCKADSQSKAEGNWRKEPREVLQGEALTCSQQIKLSEGEEHWQIRRLNMLSVSKSGGGTLPT